MGVPLRSRLLVSAWLAPLCVAAWLVVPATAGAASSAGCDERVNNTAAKLLAVHPDARSLAAT